MCFHSDLDFGVTTHLLFTLELKASESCVPNCSRAWSLLSTGYGVQGSGFRIQGTRFRVQDSGFRVQGTRFRVQGSGYKVQGSGFSAQGAGFRVQAQAKGFGPRVRLRLRAKGLG